MSTKARARQRHAPSRQGGLPLFPIVIAVVVVALLGVVLVTALGDDDGGGEIEGVQQTAAVEITGDPLPVFDAAGADAGAGTTAPAVSGQGFTGEPVQLAPDGRPKAIAFLAHWCSHCRAEVPRLAEWLEDNDVPEEIDLVLVPTSTSSTQPNYPPSEWLDDAGLTDLPVLLDSDGGEVHVAFGAGGFPYWVFLDADHRVVARMSGEFPDDQSVYTELFDALAAGEPVTDPRA